MDEDPLEGLGLQPVRMADQAKFCAYLRSLNQPLSDYTFSQIFTWGNSLRILWKEMRGHLCVFANGTGDLTLLMPPIGDGNSDRALAEAFEVMDAYNHAHQVDGHSRVEYVSDELLNRLNGAKVTVEPMGADYIYDVNRMIDLAGGDLASKRQLKNRFMRNYEYRVEAYAESQHREECLRLLHCWKDQQDAHHSCAQAINGIKRQKEALACELALQHAAGLGLKGIVVYTKPKAANASPVGASSGAEDWSLRGFTLGETLGADQSSIIIEKTDLSVRGLAQFIFSEFCRMYWSNRPLVNVGDDWGLETLAWTKRSYRPVNLLQKYVLRLAPRVSVFIPSTASEPAKLPVAVEAEATAPAENSESNAVLVRPAGKRDVDAAVALEQRCFSMYNLSKRQLQYLQQRPSAVFLVAQQEGKVVGEGISLVRHHRRGQSGRIYSLAVDGAYRGKKIGQRLLRRMIADLAERGVSRVYLEVEQANQAAVRLYEKNGFRCVGVLRDYYGQGHSGLHMMCEVSTPADVKEEPAEMAVCAPEGVC
ncbi:MAG TPA: GNAT family N-acetyltransferase [Tepidisphaeraceae bacterium]|nr:GNAT family N-acetyltransferase [Tepidisphaeraceae bacterium]